MKVFVAGPRALKSLTKSVEERLSNIIENNITVLIGDANGVDKIAQQFFCTNNYSNVIVYASQGKARNNLGKWPIEKVTVADGIKGFDFYAAKDVKMANVADYGFMIWNGKSKGTLNNIINLTKRNKKVLVFFTPHEKFYTINTLNDAEKIASACGNDIGEMFNKLAAAAQPTHLNNDFEQLTIF